MKWVIEPWRKLYKPTGRWLKLSVSARGLGSELLKYADDDGTIIDCGAEDPGLTVAFMLGARPREHERIHLDVEELLADGYLIMDGVVLRIRNFVEAQEKRSPNALRIARHRARKPPPVCADEIHQEMEDEIRDEMPPRNVSETGNETKRNETKRNELDKAPQPESAKRIGVLTRAWVKAGLPPNGNAFEMGKLADEIDAARSVGAEAGTPIPNDEAICAALKTITDGWKRDGLKPKMQPSHLATALGQAIDIAGRRNSDPMALLAKANLNTRGDS